MRNANHTTGSRAGRSFGPLALAAACLALLLAPSTASAVDPPLATTGASSPGAESWLRNLEGSVIPGGFMLTECRFDYVEDSDYDPAAPNPYAGGASAPCAQTFVEIGSGTDPVAVSAIAGPLEPDATYHYRLVAGNALGTGAGEDRTFTTGPAPADSCPNADRRAEQGIIAQLLPDCMALEMVSPPEKNSYPARWPFVSADGDRIAFFTNAALGEDPSISPFGGALYLAGRGASGWSSEITVPRFDPPLRAIWNSQDRASFTPDFSHWLGMGANDYQQQQGIAVAYKTGVDGNSEPMSDPLVPDLTQSAVVRDTDSQGASADHSHLYFKPGQGATYLPDDPEVGDNDPNVYLVRTDSAGEPAPVRLLQRDSDDKVWGGSCGARLGGIGPVTGSLAAKNGERNQGAISADGQRTYLSARAAQPDDGSFCDTANKLRILERLETPTGPEIAPLFTSECARPATPDPPGPCSSDDGDDLYQGASLDQSKVYFTTNRQLADSDIDGSGAECTVEAAVAGCDLYLYDSDRPVGEHLVQVSAGEDATPGEGANVYNGITAVSADGSRAYFVAEGVLTEDENPAGDTAQVGEPNLYLWEAGSESTAYIGTLDSDDAANGTDGLWGGQGTWQNSAYPVPVTDTDVAGNRIGGDGHVLVFLSRAELTPEDGDGTHLDAYRYDSEAGELECLSCHPASNESEPDDAPFHLADRGQAGALGTDFAENHRWVSENGQTVTFRTAQPLVPGDVDDAEDFYLWRAGELVLLPGDAFVIQTQLDDGAFLSHDGSTVAFHTATPLLPQDGDTASDVYVARVGGGYPEPPVPQLCQGEECRGEPSTEPEVSGAGSAALRGAGNVTGGQARNRCAGPARRARTLSKRARADRRSARRLARNGRRGRAAGLRRRGARFAKAAKRTSNRAKRCRRAARRANADRRASR